MILNNSIVLHKTFNKDFSPNDKMSFGTRIPTIVPKMGDALQTQLAYLTLVNNVQMNPRVADGEKIFKDCIAKTKVKVINNDLSVCTNPNANLLWIILNKPTSIRDAASILKNYFDNAYMTADEILTSNMPDIKVRALLLKTLKSRDFLTEDYRNLKISKKPNYPTRETFIKGLDIPIYKRFKFKTEKGRQIYGVLNPFAEPGGLHFVKPDGKFDMEAFNRTWDSLNGKLSGTNYQFSNDFCKDISLSAGQMGFIGETPYLFDSECVEGRRLVDSHKIKI